ncbi:MAG: hypothetical protein NC548_33395 [Lachnospiraceae bacterium]|nr:hypothetical protein [Lachnospiraceae bacterium]
MKIKIKCPCHATFEIRTGIQHPDEITCPNCGKPLPDNASSDLLKMFESFQSLHDKLVYRSSAELDTQYSYEISSNN